MSKPLALIVGVGDGVSASFARLMYKEGYHLVLSARNVSKLGELAKETEATTVACDASKNEDVQRLFQSLPGDSPLKVVLYNPSLRVHGPIVNVDPDEVKKAIDVTAYGSFLVGQQAAAAMLKHGQGGTILFTGASAGVKGFPQSAAFAMGKFAQRGLAQSMARELHPQNIHVCWLAIDGLVRGNPGFPETSPDSMLDPGAIAQNYFSIIQQDRTTWSDEIFIRPWVEKF